MGYNIKTAFCDLVELEKGGVATISAIFGSETFERQIAERESVVDLKLGSLSDLGISLANISKDRRGSHMEQFLPTAGSLKRARTPSNGGQVVSCLVDGCKSDLGTCRDYHRRHKVCEMHSKAPKVTIGGHEQRFCQQCSRFHALTEFDEGKRSCRKRLEGHNRRRRKPQPETLPVNHENFLSATPGGKYLPFSNQPIIPSSSVVSTMWSTAVRAESDSALFNSSSVSSSYSRPYRGKQFPFLQGPDSPLTTSNSAGQMLPNNPSPLSGDINSGNTRKMLCNDLNQVISSDRALSLLSSSPADAPEMGLGPMNPARSMMSSLQCDSNVGHFGGPHSQGLEGQPGVSAFMSNMSSSNSLFPDVFQSGTSSGSSASGGHQTLSFSWE